MTRTMALDRPLRLLLAALAAAALSGCAAITAIGAAGTPLEAYALTPASAGPAAGATGQSLTVELPAAAGDIDTDRILVKPSLLQAQYLAGARWVDPAPQLVQSLLVATLQDAGAFRHVGRPQVGPFPDYTLLTEVRAFQAEATTREGPPYIVRVGLVVSLVREADNLVIATRAFEAQRLADAIDPAVLVPAFDAATDEVLVGVRRWLLARFGLAA